MSSGRKKSGSGGGHKAMPPEALELVAARFRALAEPMRRWVEAPCAALRRRLHRERLARQAPPALHLVGSP